MTEKSPTLLSSVFTPQPKGVSYNSGLIGDRNSGANSDNSFSQELSRATGQRQPARDTTSAPRQDRAASSNGRSENSDLAATSVRDSSQKQTGTSSESESAEDTSASQLDQSTSENVDDKKVKKSAEPDSTTSDAAVDSDEAELETSVPTDMVAIGALVDTPEVASSVVNSLQADSDKPAVLSTVKVEVKVKVKVKGLETGTELMPAQLHARQLQQANKAEALQAETIASDITLVDTQKVKPTATPPIAVAAQISSAALLAGASKTQIEAQSVVTATTPQGDPESNSLELEEANSINSLSAQRRLNLSDTLTDAKLQAQQAAEQKQVLEVDQARIRQLAQQQTLASASTNTIVQETGDSLPDNMSHSIVGGIVTAPVMQRTDGSNAQLATAPMNIPILHNDADKAMAGNIRWMVNENVKQAVVNVTPSGMGPISVSIGIENEQMNISIVAVQGSTREALDSMLPRLREQILAQGHDGVKVDISDGRSENSGNENARHAADSEQGEGSDQKNANPSASVEQAQKNESSAIETAATNNMEGFLMLDKSGQIQSGYDVYV